MFFLSGLLSLLLAGAAVGMMPSAEEDLDEGSENANSGEVTGDAAAGSPDLLDSLNDEPAGATDDAAVPGPVVSEEAAQGPDGQDPQDEAANAPEETATDDIGDELGDPAQPDGADMGNALPSETGTTTSAGVEPGERGESDPATDGDDILWGALDDDVIAGGAGDDQINGYEGADTIAGGAGDDILLGGAGCDTLEGGEADDHLSGDDDADSLSGGAGDDTLAGCMGDDTLSGDEGDDSLSGGAGDDSLDGGDGNDTLMGDHGADSLSGGLGMDELFGGKGDDLIVGLVPDGETGNSDIDGKDYLNGGEGADTLMTGTGDWASGGEGGDLFAAG